MVERLVARARRFERDRELLLDALLPDKLVEATRAERLLELLVLHHHRGLHHLGHLGHAPTFCA